MEGDDNKDFGGFKQDDSEHFEEEDESFDVSQFIDPDEDASKARGKDEGSFTYEEATASGEVEEEEIDLVSIFMTNFWLGCRRIGWVALIFLKLLASWLQVVYEISTKNSLDHNPRREDGFQSRFEQYKLVVCGLSEKTTDESVLNFIETLSGEEVKEVSRLGKSKALVTMADRLKDFSKIKAKGDRSRLDSSQVSIERVPVCTSILVNGISDSTTHDAIELYFESQRNSGGPVSKVQFQPNSGRAVVVFQDRRDMERVLARQQERPHVLNSAVLSLRFYHEILEDGNKDDSDSAAVGDGSYKNPVSQRSESETKQLNIAVNPDVMEYVTATSHHDQLKKALAAKKSEINWKPNSKMAVVVYRGEDKSDSWQSDCIREVQNQLGKFTTRDVKVNKDFWVSVKTRLSNIKECLGIDPPLVKTVDDAFVLRVVSLSSDAEKFENQLKAILKELFSIQTERFTCPSKLDRRYLSDHRQDDLCSIETQLANFKVKIQTGGGDDDFVIYGNKEGLKRSRRMLKDLLAGTDSKVFEVKQPGLRKYFTSGEGDHLVKSVEKDHACAIYVKRNFDKKQEGMHTGGTGTAVESEATSGDDGDEHYAAGRRSDDQEEEAVVRSTDPFALVTANGHKISWKAGYIQTEKADILVSSQGACSQAIITAGGQAMTQSFADPNTGDITVTSGSGTLACNHVIHTNCSNWNGRGGEGETVLRTIVQKCLQKGEELGGTSIAFPIIGAGKLKFPPKDASRIMLDEVIGFCKNNPSSTVKDVRFVVYQQDQTLITAFGQEMATLQSQHKLRPRQTMTGFSSRNIEFLSKFGVSTPAKPTGGLSIEVLQGDLCHETTDAIVNINSKDMNMESAGALSKAVKKASGVQEECTRLGRQAGGSVVRTSSGTLAARGISHIIHLIPASKDKNHLQQCVEKCLRLAESKGVQSISFPAVGTGHYGMSAVDSASLIFHALSNFSVNFNTIRKIRIVVFQAQMLPAFHQEQQRHPLLSNQGAVRTPGAHGTHISKNTRLSIEVIKGDLTKERTDAIININSTNMNMSDAGKVSKAILAAGGAQIQRECSQLGQQTAGSAVITSGGNLAVPHIIHIIPGSKDKQHLQTCLEAGLRLADTHNLCSVSIPSLGTGGYGLAAADSAQLTFQALNNFSGNCKSVRRVRVVVFQSSMMQEFLQAQQGQVVVQDVDERGSDSSSDESVTRQPRTRRSGVSITNDPSVKISVTGKDKASVEKAVDFLKKGFSSACTTQKVKNDTITQLSQKQIDTLRKKAKDRDVSLEIEKAVTSTRTTMRSGRIVVRGDSTEVLGMVGEIWHEINERNKKIKEEEQALLVSMNVEWSYEIQGAKMPFIPKTNAKIEMAYSKEQATVRVFLRGDEFIIDLKGKSGQGLSSRETITLSRKVKGVQEGIPLPKDWEPMPHPDMKVHKVRLDPLSPEYQDVMHKVQATASGVNIQKIERVQNPYLYQCYMVRKKEMDKTNTGKNERQLFHGTDAKNTPAINTQGFNRSFCGVHGSKFGQGVYFARDASYSVNYAGRGGNPIGHGAYFARPAGGGGDARHMYLARVLVGTYCSGNSSLKAPPPKNPSRPEVLYDSVVDSTGDPTIFVVFYDNQCYPEYLITFK